MDALLQRLALVALSFISCGKECPAAGMYKPNCTANACQCGDNCSCVAGRSCCRSCRCAGPKDALDQLNAQRKARGLRPYLRDDGLTRAAKGAAKYRAERLMDGHTRNDFSAVPPGSHASAAGCAAWPASMGFGSCCCYETWRYAGAASCRGRDGRIYHHLFVR